MMCIINKLLREGLLKGLINFYDYELSIIVAIDFPYHSDNSTQVMEEEVAHLIVHLLADENHKFMRPHAGGEAYYNIKIKHTH